MNFRHKIKIFDMDEKIGLIDFLRFIVFDFLK